MQLKLWQPMQLEEPGNCPYLPGRTKRFEYFLATEVGSAELSLLLAQGWRKFGPYFFRPRCPGCCQCIPLRVKVQEFAPSRSQRRGLRKGASLDVRFGPLQPSEEGFHIYRRHSLERFGQHSTREDFLAAFYQPSCPALQIDILLQGKLLGLGFLDRGQDGLSSVYFCFDPGHEHLSPGTFSILMEIEQAASLGLDWYYLGYYVPGCPRMSYKDRFLPREYFDWENRRWFDPDVERTLKG